MNKKGFDYSQIALFIIIAVLFIFVGFTIALFVTNAPAATASRASSSMNVTATPILVESKPQIVPPVYPSRPPEYPLRNSTTSYQQMGVLVLNEPDAATPEPVILPLFGRKQYSRDRWEYYCASDKFHMMRLPVSFENRDCQDDVGCNEIYNGQSVSVPDYGNKPFTARIYKYRDRTNPQDV